MKLAGARLWSVLSRSEAKAKEFAAKHQAQAARPAHTDLAELLKDPELHAVIIATPDGLHAEQAIAAARAGKHVLVEKPMAMDVASAERVIGACREAKVQLSVAYRLRFHPGHRQLTKQLHAGELGEVKHVIAQWGVTDKETNSWRTAKGTSRWWGLSKLGSHTLDLLRWTLVPACGEVVEVRSMIRAPRGLNDETSVLMLRFANGVMAEMLTSIEFDLKSRIEIFTSKHAIACEETLLSKGAGKIAIDGKEQPFEPANQFQAEIASFAAAIAENRAPEVTGEDGLKSVAILQQATS